MIAVMHKLFVAMLFCGTWLATSLVLSGSASADEEKLFRIYHGADWSNHKESAQSIWRGVETALTEVGYEVNGYRFELVKKDHHGNVLRSRRNLESFLNDPKALIVVAGMHSPPMMKNRDFVNENKIPVLVPWAAGGPITRYPSEENWIFRLSVNDEMAASVMAAYALDVKKCTSPHLLLEVGPWGDSNLATLSETFSKAETLNDVHVTRHDWNGKPASARSILRSSSVNGYDCIILVSNAIEGVLIANAMRSLPEEQRTPIISHWGITGGQFHVEVDAAARSEIDLSFVQTCFSFLDTARSPLADKVFLQAKAAYPDIKAPKDIKSPPGFIHGYDLTRLFIRAFEKIQPDDDILSSRVALREALENLDEDISGLVKTYRLPFVKFDPMLAPDAHEALRRADICMAKYNDQDAIEIIR